MENNFSTLDFQNVDRGNFEFHNWKEKPVFIGKFERFWISKEKGGDDPVTGTSMTDQNGQRFNMGESWQIKDFFDDEETEGVDFTNHVYKITFKGQKETAKGQSVNVFEFAKAKLS
jgi:hypothetical protein